MKQILLSLSLLLCTAYICAADLSTGQIYRIVPLTSDNKVVMVQNSSLNRDANTVVWTETEVNSQRWLLEAIGENSWQLQNTYSGMILYRNGNAVEGTKVCQYDKNDLAAGKWEIVAVENRENVFYFTQPDRNNEETLYLEYLGTEDGSQLELHTKKQEMVQNVRCGN